MEWPQEIDKVYVLIHTVKEKKRFDRLIPHLISNGIPPGMLEICAPTWSSDLTNDLIFKVYDPFCRPGLPNFTFKARCLSKGEISLVLNFLAAAQNAISNNFNKVIILESDVWLREDFVERLNDLLFDLKNKEWDYVSLGEGVRTRPNGCEQSMYAKTKAYVPNHQFVFRCTDSMLFKVDYLKKILTTLIPFRECLDWELNIQTMHHKGKTWWADPPIIEQGTTVGREITTLIA